MNNRQLYLAWLRTVAPTVYINAVRKALGKTKSLGGLADDLVNKAFSPDLTHSFLGDDTDITDESALQDTSGSSTDLTTISPFDSSSVSFTPVDIASGTAVGLPSSSSGSSSSGSIFASIITAVGAVGAGVISATNQSKLIALNT